MTHDCEAFVIVRQRPESRVRIRRFSLGNPGQFRSLKNGVNEIKIDYGPGYRVYYTFKGRALILLLCGGDKSTQSKDIHLATEIAASWET